MKQLGWAALAVALAFGLREFFPKRVVSPPRIVTVYDTVTSLDTVWLTKLVQKTRWDTVYLERVTVTRPETVTVVPRVRGLVALTVPNRVGDSTVAQGFMLTPTDSGSIEWLRWRAQWWTPGPLRAISLDTLPPRIAFWPAPPPPCTFFCKLKYAGYGGLTAIGLVLVLRP